LLCIKAWRISAKKKIGGMKKQRRRQQQRNGENNSGMKYVKHRMAA